MVYTIFNKTITPINVVVIQIALVQPIGYGRHMNISPGKSVQLDIGEVTFKQFKVYIWGGGSKGTEISTGTIEAYIAGRAGIALATMGTHSIVHHLAENVVLDVCHQLVLHNIANEIITAPAFEHAVTKGVQFVIENVVTNAITPKHFGVLMKSYASAVKDRVRYVYGGPMIQEGKILPGGKQFYLGKQDNGYDPVSALRTLSVQKDNSGLHDLPALAGTPSKAVSDSTVATTGIVALSLDTDSPLRKPNIRDDDDKSGIAGEWPPTNLNPQSKQMIQNLIASINWKNDLSAYSRDTTVKLKHQKNSEYRKSLCHGQKIVRHQEPMLASNPFRVTRTRTPAARLCEPDDRVARNPIRPTYCDNDIEVLHSAMERPHLEWPAVEESRRQEAETLERSRLEDIRQSCQKALEKSRRESQAKEKLRLENQARERIQTQAHERTRQEEAVAVFEAIRQDNILKKSRPETQTKGQLQTQAEKRTHQREVEAIKRFHTEQIRRSALDPFERCWREALAKPLTGQVNDCLHLETEAMEREELLLNAEAKEQ